jgi:hypothetical protein
VKAILGAHCLFARIPPVMVVPLLPPKPTSIILHEAIAVMQRLSILPALELALCSAMKCMLRGLRSEQGVCLWRRLLAHTLTPSGIEGRAANCHSHLKYEVERLRKLINSSGAGARCVSVVAYSLSDTGWQGRQYRWRLSRKRALVQL